jgi:hypothetical protein
VEVPGSAVREGKTHSIFVRGLIVHDDQRGPYRVLPLSAADVEHLPDDRLLRKGDVILTVDDNVSHMFVPLPSRVFLSAEKADIVVRDYVQLTSAASKDIVKVIRDDNEKGSEVVSDFFDGVENGRWVQRTYLTTAARYRRHISRSEMTEDMKSAIISRSLPHFVWVTELIDRSSKQEGPNGARRVVGHFVLNATSSTDYNSDLLIAQIPHIIVHRDVNPMAADDEVVDPKETMVQFDKQVDYLGRTRTV